MQIFEIFKAETGRLLLMWQIIRSPFLVLLIAARLDCSKSGTCDLFTNISSMRLRYFEHYQEDGDSDAEINATFSGVSVLNALFPPQTGRPPKSDGRCRSKKSNDRHFDIKARVRVEMATGLVHIHRVGWQRTRLTQVPALPHGGENAELGKPAIANTGIPA